jgi:hypothetical protein
MTWNGVFYMYAALIALAIVTILIGNFDVNWHPLNYTYGKA